MRTTDTAEAYRACEEITWSQARNFAYGIRLLPAGKRRALAALYAFARRIDDIGDGTMPPGAKLAALEEARAEVLGMTCAGPSAVAGDDPVLIALADAGKQFAVPMQAFGELIDGCVADVNGAFYATFDDLLSYCRCVAGSIGRLSLGVFGAPDMRAAEPLADSLGVALQLTNILRDIREDYRNGRVYLPAAGPRPLRVHAEAGRRPAGPGRRAGCGPGRRGPARPAHRVRGEPRAGLVRDRHAAAAPCSTAAALRVPARWPASTGSCWTASQPGQAAVLHGRVSLSPREKALVAVRSLARPMLARRPRVARRRRRPGPRRPGPRRRRSPNVGQVRGAGRACRLRPARRKATPVSAQPAAGPRRVVVIGGGLAGITAAIALAEAGAAVTLLEARPRLGGATTSFNRGALVVDTGQHVFLRCCTAYRGLLARLGMTGSVRIQDRFDVTVLSPDGTAQLRRNTLPGPLHMGAALARYPMLSLAERAQVTRAALAMRMLNPADPALDTQRLGDWLAAHGQDERTRRVLWDLFTVSSLNIDGDDASLALAATVVKTALLGKRDAADIGVPLAPLGELHGTAGLALLRRLGAEVRLGVKAAAVEVAAPRDCGR